MAKPVYIIAGQSNAAMLEREIEAALDATLGRSGHHAAGVHGPGAPLTYEFGREDWAAADELKQTLIETLDSILAADPRARFDGFIWLQGEGDTHAAGQPDVYAARFEALIADVMAELSVRFPGRHAPTDDVNIVISGLSENAPAAATRVNWDGVQDALADAARATDAAFVDPDAVAAAAGVSARNMFADEVHYTTSFQQVLANALVDSAVSPDQPGRLVGGARNDVLRGGDRDEFIGGVAGNDRLFGAGGDDVLVGGGGHDTLRGGRDGDVLRDGGGRDRLIGGGGDDTLRAGGGADELRGGAGADLFVFRPTGHVDRILDFSDGKDLIKIKGGFAFEDLTITKRGDDAVVRADDFRLIVEGPGAFELDEGDFLF